MMMEGTSSRSLAERSGSRPGRDRTGQTAQAGKSPAMDPSRIAQRAYELYEQRGRQDGRDLEDWLNAERQLTGAGGK